MPKPISAHDRRNIARKRVGLSPAKKPFVIPVISEANITKLPVIKPKSGFKVKNEHLARLSKDILDKQADGASSEAIKLSAEIKLGNDITNNKLKLNKLRKFINEINYELNRRQF